MASANPYKLFDVILHRKTLLSPHMMRITLASPAVKEMATWAPDQRVKLFFPAADGSPARLAQGEGWYARFKAMIADYSDYFLWKIAAQAAPVRAHIRAREAGDIFSGASVGCEPITF